MRFCEPDPYLIAISRAKWGASSGMGADLEPKWGAISRFRVTDTRS